MDEFEQKHEMVQMLLDMLKRSASDEVMDGMKKPDGMPEGKGLEIEKVSVVPHEHEEGDMSPEAATLADEVMPKGSIAEEMKRAPEMAAEDDAESHADDEGDDEMEDSPSHAFSSLMKRKGKK